MVRGKIHRFYRLPGDCMIAFCTYCSASKDTREGVLPAVQRYQSERIQRVRDMAHSAGASFWILSGEFGLVPESQPIPFYDHQLLASEVPDLSARVAGQLEATDIVTLVYLSPPAGVCPSLEPYWHVISTACAAAGVKLEIRTMQQGKLSWREITHRAAAASHVMVTDLERGLAMFEELLEQAPGDAMIFLQRAEAYEKRGQYEEAFSDFGTAEIGFPMEQYKERAREGAARVSTAIKERKHGRAWFDEILSGLVCWYRRLPLEPGPLAEQLERALENAVLAPEDAAVSLRRCLEILLASLSDDTTHNDTKPDLFDRIRGVESRPWAPDIIISHMHTVRCIGNAGAHLSLSPQDALPGIAAMICLLGWWSNAGTTRRGLFRG